MSEINGRIVTDAHIRALQVLDGAWQTKLGRNSAACKSLEMYHACWVESEWGDHGPRGGRCLAYRLNCDGLEAKATLTRAKS